MHRYVFMLFAAWFAGCTPLHDDLGVGDSGVGEAEAPEGSTPNPSIDAGYQRDAADARASGPVDTGIGDEHASGLPEAGDCEALALTESNIYVDGSSVRPEQGTASCPYLTIAAAIAAAQRASVAEKTIHVASGTYAKGETFPIDLRNGISLVGAGAATTVIQGYGKVSTDSGGYWSSLFATVRIGDRALSSALRAVKLVPVSTPTNGLESVGVFCEEGNVRFPAPTPAHNTELSDLVIAPGFVNGVTLVGTAYGCNMRMVRSTLQGGSPFSYANGVLLEGAGCDGWGGPGASNPVALELGDGTPAGGNTITGLHGASGAAVVLQGCATVLNVSYNTIEDSDIGLWLESLPAAGEPISTVSIVGNSFQQIGGESTTIGSPPETVLVGAVFIQEPAAAVTISGNNFSGVRAQPGAPPVPALTIAAFAAGSAFPSSVHARDNQFVGNDIGLLIQTRGTNALSAASVLDFGTNGNGNNQFRCNARSAAGPGGDVVIDANTDGTGAIGFSGDAWDHATPVIATSANASDGTDVKLARSTNPTLDTGNARPSPLPCPTGFSP